jgi:hypothetical protein
MAGKRKKKRLLRPQYPIIQSLFFPLRSLATFCGSAVNLPAAGARAMSKKRAAAFATAPELVEV